MKKIIALAAALTASMGANAAYRDNGGVDWPTLFAVEKTECSRDKANHRPLTHKPIKVASFDSIYFGYKSATVSGSKSDLKAAKRAMKAAPSAQFVVVGHTDSKGAEAYNAQLSKQRAEAVRTWLINNGVDGSRLTAAGLGESHPVGDNATAEGRAKNRRVELHRAN